MIRKAIFVLFFFILHYFVKGQIYIGTSLNNAKEYHCYLKINTDSTIVFVYHTKQNEIYGEYVGRIYKSDDTLFRITATMSFGKFDIMRLYTRDTNSYVLNDTDYFCINSNYYQVLNPIKIKYSNGQIVDFDYEKQNCLVLDRRYFNKTKGSDYYFLLSNKVEEFTKEPLSFIERFGSVPSFENGETIEFKIIIKDDKIKSNNVFLLQTGDFVLKKQFH
jgi:hypothetical protein